MTRKQKDLRMSGLPTCAPSNATRASSLATNACRRRVPRGHSCSGIGSTAQPSARSCRRLSRVAPEGTVLIPQNKNWLFNVSGVMVEGDDQHGVDVQYPWDAHPHRSHSQVLSVGPFYMDKYPVTTTNYSAYLAATGFTPLDTYRWLKNWGTAATEADGAGEMGVPSGPPRVPPAGIADMPVTYVSLEEARDNQNYSSRKLYLLTKG